MSRLFKKSIYALPIAQTLIASNCKGPKQEGLQQEVPAVQAICPSQAHPVDTLSITGTNLIWEGIITGVTLDGAALTAIGFDATKLEAVVPAGKVLGTNSLAVTVGDMATDAGTLEIKEYITLQDYSSKTGKFGTTITVTGENFTSAAVVTVNSKELAIMVSSDSTTITFDLAADTYSGEVRVAQDGKDTAFAGPLDYELTFGTPEAINNLGGTGITMYDDGSYAIAINESVKIFDTNNTLIKTVTNNDTTVNLYGLYLKDGVLYAADFNGRILYYEEGADSLKTLVSNDIAYAGVHAIVGDDHYLYVSSPFSKKVFRVDLEAPVKKVEYIATATNRPLGIELVGDTLFCTAVDGIWNECSHCYKNRRYHCNKWSKNL